MTQSGLRLGNTHHARSQFSQKRKMPSLSERVICQVCMIKLHTESGVR